MINLFQEVWLYLKLLKWTAEQIGSFGNWTINKPKSTDLIELINGEIDIGKPIKTTGLISEYVPIMPTSKLELSQKMSSINFAFKSYEINNKYCSIIQDVQIQEPSKDSIPLFYTYDTPRPTKLNAREVEIIGETVSIPNEWLKKLNIKSPIGINVKKIIPKGDRKDLFLPVWLILEGVATDKSKLEELISGRIMTSTEGKMATYKFGMPIDKDMKKILFICGSSGSVYDDSFVFEPTNISAYNPDETRIVNFAKMFSEIGYNVEFAYDLPKFKI